MRQTMDKYKPTYMGQVMPVDNPSKMTDFVSNKYESFSKCYDAVKSESEKINGVSPVQTNEGTSEFSMKVNTDSATMENIAANAKDVSVDGNTVNSK